MKTRRRSNEMERIRVRLRFDSCMVVEPVGRGGGLALLWLMEVNLEVLSYSKNHIDVVVRGHGSNQEKLGGLLRDRRLIDAFRNTVCECGLQELPVTGPFYTWSRRYSNEILFERINRGMATVD
ncbi:hypothetical protein PTKIN_Ptkin01aG0245300 [Pterospermum kingtungense]